MFKLTLALALALAFWVPFLSILLRLKLIDSFLIRGAGPLPLLHLRGVRTLRIVSSYYLFFLLFSC